MTSQKYLLKSNYDDTIFEVNENVINSSSLLKNLIEFTTISSIPISINCSGRYLKVFIDLIKIQEKCSDDNLKYDFKVAHLFKNFTNDDTALANFIKETCILDSDILLDVLADKILSKLCDMNRIEMNEYLEVEDDFTAEEREWQNQNMLEYFISLNENILHLYNFHFYAKIFILSKQNFLLH